MDVSHELYRAIQRVAGQARLVSQPQLSRELQLSATECDAVVEELIARGLLRRTQSDKGQTYFWVSGTAEPGGTS
jgi:hypothetical protein